MKFIFITCAAGEAFFNPVKKGMNDAAALMGVTCDFTGTEDVDIEAQAEMVRQAVADRYDGIALSVIHAEAFNNVISEALAVGVPVVAFNTDGTYGKGPHLGAVHQDLFQAGRTLGMRVAEILPSNVKVLMTVHSEGISALEDRLRGIQEVLWEKRKASWKCLVTRLNKHSMPTGTSRQFSVPAKPTPKGQAGQLSKIFETLGFLLPALI
jgi:simple sugar transport system substrate-binding protein